jgi:hypothetical protein
MWHYLYWQSWYYSDLTKTLYCLKVCVYATALFALHDSKFFGTLLTNLFMLQTIYGYMNSLEKNEKELEDKKKELQHLFSRCVELQIENIKVKQKLKVLSLKRLRIHKKVNV